MPKLKFTSTPVKAQVHKYKLTRKPTAIAGPDPIKPKQYFDSWGAGYNAEGARSKSGTCIPVLQGLWGRKLDEVVMAYVHALRPSLVRIVDKSIKLDSRCWRVTIWVRKHGRCYFVQRIEQEVEVLLPGGVAHADALRLAKLYGANSPQVKWHRDATGYIINNGYWKDTKKGTVKWKFKRTATDPKLWLDADSCTETRSSR